MQRAPVALHRPPWDWRNMLFPYKEKAVPGPGTGNWAMLPAFSLPGNSIGGAGVIFGNGSSGLDILPGQQLVYSQAQVTSGVEGVVFGGMNPQGLVDMDKLIKAQAA